MKYLYLLLLLFLYACASTPEAKLKQGYDTANSVVSTATVLLNRGEMSSADAVRVLDAGYLAKASLDAGKDRLAACRAADPTDKCSDATLNIDLGAGLLMELERYLEAQQ